MRIKRRHGSADTNPVTATSLIRIMCPNLSCQRILAVPEGARGKVVRCRVCGMNVKIPARKGGAAASPDEEKGSARKSA
ncbi:MAG: hypothetical protein IID28_12770 [Planctomycetes bacterium]|nr:hypothetical protein [Planctomycetota bacterium]